MPFREIARAKINLTLTLLGRRPDGYHDLESLVTFAGIGDRVTLYPGSDRRVTTAGPFAAHIEGPNLLEHALDLLRELDPGLRLGVVELEKNLPVAAGLGSGSADAAALLRAVRQANPERADRIDWHGLAARLGADVPVCLAGVPALIRGIGDRIEPLDPARRLPPLAAVLVNPGVPLSTAQVFRALAALSPSPRTSRGEGRGEGQTLAPASVAAPHPIPLPAEVRGEGTPAALGETAFPNLEALLSYIRARGNDLECLAASLAPVIADVKAALSAQPTCRLAAMSGSGPTCFGIFGNATDAAGAAAELAVTHPGWWIVQTRLDCPAPAELNSPG